MGSAPRRTQTAIELLTASLVRAAAGSDRRGVAMAVEGLADAHACLGEALIAARILGAADALRDEIGGAPPIMQRGCLDGAERVGRSISRVLCTTRSTSEGGPKRTASSPAWCQANPRDVRM